MRLPPDMSLRTKASLPVSVMLRALPVPTNRPASLSTRTTPVVLVFWSVRMNELLAILLRKLALLAVPANVGLLVVVSVMPGNTVGKVLTKLAWGVKLAPSNTMPTRLLFTNRLVMNLVAPTESRIVSGIAPDVPWVALKAGPTTKNAAPVHTFSC